MSFSGTAGKISYVTNNGSRIAQENLEMPDGKILWFCWVYRRPDNTVIDFDVFQNDLFERNGIEIIDSGAK